MSDWRRVHRAEAFPAEWDVEDFWTVACKPIGGGAHDHMVAPPGRATCCPMDDTWRMRLVPENPHRCPFRDCLEKLPD